jgi:probable phosphoglycerate mutase
MAQLQARVVAHLEELRDRGLAAVVVVSHAEPIRAALLHLRGLSLDRFNEIVIPPAGVETINLAPVHAARELQTVRP